MSARKKFRQCGHINFGKECPRCKEANRVEKGYTSKKGNVFKPDKERAELLRQSTNDTAKRRRWNFPNWE
jgi:hypothetical protein